MKNFYALSSLILVLFFASCSDDDDGSESNPVVAVAADISGGPFVICVDGNPQTVSGISLGSGSVGSGRSWVITDDQGTILGLPPTLDDVENVDFDAAGPGTCFIWYLRYEGEISGLEAGMNADNLQGNFDLSNSIEVSRNEVNAGVLSGGPFEFTVDGTPDFVSGITLDNSSSAGSNSSWVITDDLGNILGLPPTLDAVEGVDFDAAGPGVCFIWYIRYEDGLQGLEAGMNVDELEGCYCLTEGIQVTRNDM